jgi:hypothetical protein
MEQHRILFEIATEMIGRLPCVFLCELFLFVATALTQGAIEREL